MIGLIRRYVLSSVLVVLSLSLVSENVKAQKIEITPFVGYFTVTRLTRDENYLGTGGGIGYGISMNHKLGRIWRLEFSYSSLKSDLSLISAHGYRERFSDLKSRFFSMGAMAEFHPEKKVSSYLLPALGFIYYHPLNGHYYDERVLHFSLAYGVKYSFNDILGLRFQARLLMPVWHSGEYFPGKYYEMLARLNTTKVSVQGDFAIGIILKIPKRISTREDLASRNRRQGTWFSGKFLN